MKEREIKGKIISVKCSSKEKEQIQVRAEKLGMSTSKYLKEVGLRSQGNIRKSIWQKAIAKDLCQLQTIVNGISKNISNEEYETMMKGMNKLWENL